MRRLDGEVISESGPGKQDYRRAVSQLVLLQRNLAEDDLCWNPCTEIRFGHVELPGDPHGTEAVSCD